jgi:hypothetical protein
VNKDGIGPTYDYIFSIKKRDWGTLVPRINVENGNILGFLLE